MAVKATAVPEDSPVSAFVSVSAAKFRWPLLLFLCLAVPCLETPSVYGLQASEGVPGRGEAVGVCKAEKEEKRGCACLFGAGI